MLKKQHHTYLSPNNISSEIRPVISICIPTFNRSNCLENLLKNLAGIKAKHGFDVEICISNNQSTDNTGIIIERWRVILNLIIKTQLKNVGGSQNAIEVTKMAQGKWILIIGDDDEIIPDNFDQLLIFLRSKVKDCEWVLLGVADSSGRESLLGDVSTGDYDAQSFRKLLLKKGLYRFGFIGMHLFPARLKPIFFGLTSEESQPWAHIALLLRQLQFGDFKVYNDPVVCQAPNGLQLFFSSGDWMKASLRKLDIVAGVSGFVDDWYWYYQVLILREIYSWGSIKSLIFWKIFEPSDFNKSAFKEFVSRYKLLKSLKILTIGHLIILLVFLASPTFFINILLKMVGKKNVVDAYMINKNSKRDFDWISRGA